MKLWKVEEGLRDSAEWGRNEMRSHHSFVGELGVSRNHVVHIIVKMEAIVHLNWNSAPKFSDSCFFVKRPLNNQSFRKKNIERKDNDDLKTPYILPRGLRIRDWVRVGRQNGFTARTADICSLPLYSLISLWSVRVRGCVRSRWNCKFRPIFRVFYRIKFNFVRSKLLSYYGLISGTY